MRICLMIEGQEGVSWDEWLALARASEEAGLEALFRSDHYASLMREDERGSLDAWATLAALAALTERIRLGTMVSPATFRHPSELAKVAATVDHVSGGRVELGLGAGWNEREHAAYGFRFPPLPERLDLFSEQLAIVHGSWTQERFSFEGRHYRLDENRALPKPVQSPPRLIVGGSARRGTADPAARLADEYNTTFASPDECRTRRRLLDEACARAGRDPATLAFSVMTGCIVARDRDELRARGRAVMEIVGADGDVDGWLRERSERTIVGTPEEARARLAEYEAAGVERVLCQHLAHRDLEMVALLAELA